MPNQSITKADAKILAGHFRETAANLRAKIEDDPEKMRLDDPAEAIRQLNAVANATRKQIRTNNIDGSLDLWVLSFFRQNAPEILETRGPLANLKYANEAFGLEFPCTDEQGRPGYVWLLCIDSDTAVGVHTFGAISKIPMDEAARKICKSQGWDSSWDVFEATSFLMHVSDRVKTGRDSDDLEAFLELLRAARERFHR